MKAELEKSLQVLKDGSLLLYPTDTLWGIGCDATNPKAVEKVYALKQRNESKALICLVADLKMLTKYVKRIPEKVKSIIKDINSPTTIIYTNPQSIASNLLAPDGSIGIRVCADPFCQQLISAFGKPIVSTSANISGASSPKSFAQISPEIKIGVDYIVNLRRQDKNPAASKIIKLTAAGEIVVIRA